MRTSEDENSDVAALINEHEDLFRRLAESDLPISEEAERALKILDGTQDGGFD